MDIVEISLEGLYDWPVDAHLLVQDVPDAARVAILATTVARPGSHTDDGLQHAVRTRYRALTQPGEPDGPTAYPLALRGTG